MELKKRMIFFAFFTACLCTSMNGSRYRPKVAKTSQKEEDKKQRDDDVRDISTFCTGFLGACFCCPGSSFTHCAAACGMGCVICWAIKIAQARMQAKDAIEAEQQGSRQSKLNQQRKFLLQLATEGHKLQETESPPLDQRGPTQTLSPSNYEKKPLPATPPAPMRQTMSTASVHALPIAGNMTSAKLRHPNITRILSENALLAASSDASLAHGSSPRRPTSISPSRVSSSRSNSPARQKMSIESKLTPPNSPVLKFSLQSVNANTIN